MTHEGGCICGQVRYAVDAAPLRVTICHCHFCQQATGGPYMIEPIMDNKNLSVISGQPKTHTVVSEGSGKQVHIHFCPDCGTKLFLTFERFPDFSGIYGGTFDDPDWFEVSPDTARHIYLSSARAGTVIPAGFDTYLEHAFDLDGNPIAPTVYDTPHVIEG